MRQNVLNSVPDYDSEERESNSHRYGEGGAATCGGPQRPRKNRIPHRISIWRLVLLERLIANVAIDPRLTREMYKRPAPLTELTIAGKHYVTITDLALIASDLHGAFF
jgi:hypothetical protein